MTAGAPARMTSNRPYLIRAMYEWISDNSMTPYLLVDAGHPGVEVPSHAVKDGRIVLNVASRAVAQLELGNQLIRFVARFAGVSTPVHFPVAAVQAIYAQETGQGMMLPQEEPGDGPGPGNAPDAPDDGGGTPKRPRLRIVK